MAFFDDWGVDFTYKRVYNKKALGINGSTTVYDVNDLYSNLMDLFDELVQMDDPVPMSAQTPTEYTMINGWFIDDESVKYLKNGAIKTVGYAHPTNITGVRVLTLDAAAGLTIDDLGKVVLGVTTGDTGRLLAYNTTRKVLWVRCDATDDLFDNASEAITVDAVACGNMTKVSESGEDLYANVYTLGTIELNPSPQIYIFQAGVAIAEWNNLTNWDRGYGLTLAQAHIDVLIKIKEAGTEIASGVITVFARQSGDLYDNFEIDLTAGGRNAVPLSTADDLNEDTGEYYLLYDGETTGFTTLGQIITGASSGATAELVTATDWGTQGVLKLRGVKGTFTDGETITGSEEGQAVVNGTVGDTYVTYDAEGGTPPGVGTTMVGGTSGAKRILRGIQDDGTAGKLVLQVDTTQTGTSRKPYYIAFQDNEQIQESGVPANYYYSSAASTTIVSGFTDITIAFVNGTATYTGGSTTEFINGERVTFTGGEGIVLLDSNPGGATGTLTLGNMTITAINGLVITGDLSGGTATASQDLQSAYTMNKAFEQQSAYPYAVIVDAGSIYATSPSIGRTLAQVYEYFKFVCQENSTFAMYTVVSAVIIVLDGEEYIIAYSGYVPAKQAPLGTFAGGKYFGAQGVWIEGMAATQSYQYTDANGVIRQPYASVTVAITSLVAGDKVVVFRTSAGAIAKDIFTSHATNNAQGDLTFEVQEDIGTVAVDTPSSGVLRIVDVSENREHRMRYASWSGSIFTLVTERTGTQTGATSVTVLNDSAASFQTWGILAGDIIRNTTDLCWAQVVSVESQTQLITTIPQGGTTNNWANTNGYSIHSLPLTYNGSDTAYVPFIDKKATTTSAEQSVLYDEERAVLIRVRMYAPGVGNSILPFETAGTVGTAGLAVAAIRTVDGIAT